MINLKYINDCVLLGFLALFMFISTGCSGPYDRQMGLSELNSQDPAIKIMAIKWAGDNKVSSAVPKLVDFLQDDDKSVRFYAIEGLRRITGEDKGFDYKAGPAQRSKAVERWREYLKSQE